MKPTRITLPHMTAEVIMYLIAMANAARLAWSYAYADANGNILSAPGLAGLTIGVTVSLGTAFIAGRIATWARKNPPTLAWIGLGLISIIEPVILTPITVTDIPPALAANLPGAGVWVWAAALAIAPSLTMVAVAFAGGAIVEKSTSPAPAAAPRQVAEQKAQPAAQSKTYTCKEPGCGMQYTNAGGHYKAHHRKVQIDAALLINRSNQ